MKENTALDVAEYMLAELLNNNILYQEYVVHEIDSKFGNDFVYENENGNLAISKKVLSEFKKLKSSHNIEWDRSERAWTNN